MSATALRDVSLVRGAVERFLYDEAALLDEWRLNEWVDLFTHDARYVVPATDDPLGDEATSLVMISDDKARLVARASRLLSGRAYRESPRSRTRRFIANVRVTAFGEDSVRATANFTIHRFRDGEHTVYVGRYLYELIGTGETFSIRHRRAELDHEALRPHATVSIIL
ncbi:MAG: aromatic-ring-hydroxylating dioxygenase subunit beta [Acidimicrobiales bacterium]